MLTITTNLQSLIAQRSLSNASSRLNQAIERMSTGFKINHSSDNAANYSITTNMGVKLSSYEVAQENVETGLDLLTTANDSLNLINDKLIRLRALQEQSMNGTYGTTSLNAINAEVNSLVDEIQRLYDTTEFNGIKLFENSSPVLSMYSAETENVANINTTFKELGIGATSFQVMNSSGLVESYDVEENDTIKDVFNVLKPHGFSTSIKNGVISITSSNGNYISGDMADAMGIKTSTETVIQSSTSSSTLEVKEVRTVTSETTTESYVTNTVTTTETITVTSTATGATTFGELGIADGTTCLVKNASGSTRKTITVSTTDTIDGFISKLAANTITASMTDGALNLTSNKGFTITGSLADELGIMQESSTTIVSTSVSSSGTLMVERTTQPVNNTSVTGCAEVPVGTFMKAVTRVDTSSMTAVAGKYALTSGTTYKISTPEDLTNLSKIITVTGTLSNVKIYLANDIDMSGIEWTSPIKTHNTVDGSFFDGNGYVISNLSGKTSLFQGTASDFEVRNLGLLNVNIIDKSASYNGGLFNYIDRCKVDNCFVTGTVQGLDAGGIAGEMDQGACIENCYFSGTVIASSGGAGGIVGVSEQGTITNCFTSGSISSPELISRGGG